MSLKVTVVRNNQAYISTLHARFPGELSRTSEDFIKQKITLSAKISVQENSLPTSSVRRL